jgi:hypothetical protein
MPTTPMPLGECEKMAVNAVRFDILGCCLHLWKYCTFCTKIDGLNSMKERFYE